MCLSSSVAPGRSISIDRDAGTVMGVFGRRLLWFGSMGLGVELKYAVHLGDGFGIER